MNNRFGICSFCKTEDFLLTDYQLGQIACSVCGVVMEERLIDELAEWRNFSVEKNEYRVGIATSEFNPNLDLELNLKN